MYYKTQLLEKPISANPWINFNPRAQLFEGLLALTQTRFFLSFV